MGALPLPAMLLFQDAANTATDVHVIMICEVVLTAIVVLLLLGLAVAGLIIYSKVNKLIKQVDAKSAPLIAQATPLISKGKEIAAHVNEIVEDLKPKIAAVTSDLQPKIKSVTDDLQQKIKAVTDDLQPKIASVTGDVQHISSVARGKVDEAGDTFTRLNVELGETVSRLSQTVQRYNETAQDVNVKAKGQVERVNGMVSEALSTTQHVSKQIQHGIRMPVEKIVGWVAAAKAGIEHLSERIPFLHQQPASRSGAKPATSGTRSTPGPVPVPQSGARVVHSAEDEARLPGTSPRNTTSNS